MHLDPFSPSFKALWEVLGDYRLGAFSESAAKEQVLANPWAGPEFAYDLLHNAIQRRDIVRASENDEIDADVTTGRQLFSPPRLLWKDEPCFELSISPEPPSWLEDEAYTLVVSDGQRIPVRRIDENYEMVGVGNTLLVSAWLRSVSIDVLLKRVSILSDRIEIDFSPKSELAFYRLSDGRIFEPWEELPKGAAPFSVLHRVQARIEPSPTEFRVVLGGDWLLSAYRQGLPSDLRLYSGEQLVWQREESSPDGKEGAIIEARVVCDGGKWGDFKQFSVLGIPAHLRPVQVIVGDQVCPLISDLSLANSKLEVKSAVWWTW
jgi:hypothetical protein